jgi:hypothetical protein
MMYFVYIIENKITGGFYVGKTSNIDKRWKRHLTIAKGSSAKYLKECFYLHSSIRRHGIDNFTIRVSGTYNTERQAFDNEISLIAKLKAEGFKLYNLTNGGEGSSGRKHSDESKRKISLSLIGHKHTEEAKQKIAAANVGSGRNLGITRSKETRQKISLGGKGNTNSLGHKHSEESKLKMSIAKKARNALKQQS